MFEIEVYTNIKGHCPIATHMSLLNDKAATSKSDRVLLKKILEYIKILERYGTRAGLPYMRYIDAGIWELRPFDNRIFFTHLHDGRFLLLHYFEKSTAKTPPREIRKAKEILQEFVTRGIENEQEMD